VDVCLLIKQRLAELGLEQRDLAVAAQVTESYISQLLTRKKAPPAVERTDVYERMGTFLKLPKGQLSAMVEAQRREELKKKLSDPPAPLFKEVRELVIGKCKPQKQDVMRDIFERQAFGELERLVTQKLLDVTKRVAREELKNENWVRTVAKLRSRPYEEMRGVILEFLDTDVFNLSPEHCLAFMGPLIDSWDLQLEVLEMELARNRQPASANPMKFHFVEMTAEACAEQQPGFEEFLRCATLSGDANEAEIAFLRGLQFKQRRPTPLYYYRELQNLRDPLHFGEISPSDLPKRRDADGDEKRMQIDSRKSAIHRWAKNSLKPRTKPKSKPPAAPQSGRKDLN
jgi:transcriptional regulator with XRE-family HTH domain